MWKTGRKVERWGCEMTPDWGILGDALALVLGVLQAERPIVSGQKDRGKSWYTVLGIMVPFLLIVAKRIWAPSRNLFNIGL